MKETWKVAVGCVAIAAICTWLISSVQLTDLLYKTDLEIQLVNKRQAMAAALSVIGAAWLRQESPERVAALLDELNVMFEEPRGCRHLPIWEFCSIAEYCHAKATAIRTAKPTQWYDGMQASVPHQIDSLLFEPESKIEPQSIFVDGKPAPAEAYLKRAEQEQRKNSGYSVVISLLESARAAALGRHLSPCELTAILTSCGKIADSLPEDRSQLNRPFRLARFYYKQAYFYSTLTSDKRLQVTALQKVVLMNRLLWSSDKAESQEIALTNALLELELQTDAPKQELIPHLCALAEHYSEIAYALPTKSPEQKLNYDEAERLWNQALTIAESKKCFDDSAAVMLIARAIEKRDVPAFEKYWTRRRALAHCGQNSKNELDRNYKQDKAQIMEAPKTR